MPELLLEDDLMTSGTPFLGSETRSTYRGSSRLSTSRPTSQSGRIGLALFRNTIRELLDCPPERVTALHRKAIRQIRLALDPNPYVEALLDLCVEVRSEGGLDVATDILAQAGDLALHYAQDFRRADTARLMTPAGYYHPNADKWLVLIRAASRASRNHPDFLPFLLSCLSARDRGVREAVVEGLAAVGKPAERILKSLAERDPDPLIRRAARESLADVSGS